MSALGSPEEVDHDVDFDELDLDLDNGDNQDDAREFVSPFSADEHYLEEPVGTADSAASTAEPTEQFQRGWRIDRQAGDTWIY
ncbi:unnamed protein product, partial [Fusarium langsethiae]